MHRTADGFNSQDAASLLTLINMSTKLMIAMEDSIIMIESSKTGWKKLRESLKGTHPQCIAFDPDNPDRAYCGTLELLLTTKATSAIAFDPHKCRTTTIKT
jgi:hypothetical protein